MLKIDLAFEKAHLYDGICEEPVPDSTLLVSRGKIAYAGPSAQAPVYEAVETIPAKGFFILPGLIDLHVHALVDETSLASFLRNGVTTVRDLASDPYEALEWKVKERAGRISAPRIFTSGPVLTCPGGYPENVWGPQVALTLKGRYQAQDRVQKLSGLGMDVIKIGLEHELGPCLSKAELEGVVTAAHSLRKRVTAHITNEADFELCVAYGVDELAHMPSRPVSDDLWKEPSKRKYSFSPPCMPTKDGPRSGKDGRITPLASIVVTVSGRGTTKALKTWRNSWDWEERSPMAPMRATPTCLTAFPSRNGKTCSRQG
jgi:hypothetical protein